jgi:hypothetical protein
LPFAADHSSRVQSGWGVQQARPKSWQDARGEASEGTGGFSTWSEDLRHLGATPVFQLPGLSRSCAFSPRVTPTFAIATHSFCKRDSQHLQEQSLKQGDQRSPSLEKWGRPAAGVPQARPWRLRVSQLGPIATDRSIPANARCNQSKQVS